MPRYRGKIIGAAAGLALAGPIGAVLGGAIGHLVDKEGEKARPQRCETELLFVANLTAILASTAAAAGRITEAQHNAIGRLFKEELGYKEDTLRLVDALIQETVEQKPDLRRLLGEFAQRSNVHQNLLLLRLVYLVAASDGKIEPTEEETIRLVAAELHIPAQDDLAIRKAVLRARRSAYNVLGIDESSTNEEIRAAYKEMIFNWHPDRVANLGEELCAFAAKRFAEIQEAYEELRRERGF